MAVVPREEADPDEILIHSVDAPDPAAAFSLSRLSDTGLQHVPDGRLPRHPPRPAYDDQVRNQVRNARGDLPPATDEDLAALIAGKDTWSVGG